ncbi:hypothetical protein [Nocardiopsis sp. NPDC006938]|uniref:hypothetical protein n=1 Tax=Nocardiopsis sp. NPDC006938 TaxID=3364337 RepID=UPI003684EFC4
MPSFDPNVAPFFSEWAGRRPGQRRDPDRASALLSVLDLDPVPLPVLGVVGSKGKGSTATYAAAALSAAGLRTVLVTGPSFRGYRERVRVDGASVSDDELGSLGLTVEAARRALPSPEESGGYLAPSGLFLVAGLLHARAVGADVCVLEAGMGGYRDELRLLTPDVVALGMVFAEHVGVLGDTVAEIAREKTRVVHPDRTRALVTLPQGPEAAPVVAGTLSEVTGGRLSPEVVDPATAEEPPERLRPRGLSAANGVLGTAAAARALELFGRSPADRERLHAVLGSVRLPARLSRHTVPGSSTEVVVDSAIDRVGVAAALAYARDLWGGVDHVLLCLPDHKDVSGAVEALRGVAVTAVRLPEEHLRFDHALPDHWGRVRAEDLSPATVSALGGRVVALGTVYFTGRMTEVLDAPTDRLFDPHTA